MKKTTILATKNGFTLIELVVAMAMIGIMIGLLFQTV
ncbi:MAG: type II secretion system GspH family protein [Planctomycetaceae bacterium]|jgi:prepilin-type N-terminal cleavage/methylation domain-containing protein|nr:type II secretion system GspH family protein [Planctomycetaceae bacterium]